MFRCFATWHKIRWNHNPQSFECKLCGGYWDLYMFARDRAVLIGIFMSAALVFMAMAVSGCSWLDKARKSQGATTIRPAVEQAAIAIVEATARALVRWILPGAQYAPAVPMSTPKQSATVRTRGAVEAKLVSVRSWSRPVWGGIQGRQRVRLGVGSAGRLGIAYVYSSGLATIEDTAGRVVWQNKLDGRDWPHSPLLWAGSLPLARDGTDLVMGSAVLGPGSWEAYAGVPGAAIAWDPCSVSPCHASVLTPSAINPWAREVFGIDMIDLQGGSTGTVAIATRENPSNAGYTLRIVDAVALRSGVIAELERTQVWKPPSGLSLEDPAFARNSKTAIVIGTAYDLAAGPPCPSGKPCGAPSGRVFLASSNRPLLEIGRVGATSHNAEIGAAVIGETLYIAAEIDANRSGLWKLEVDSMPLIGTIPGEAPSLAVSEGILYMSSSAGLWSLTH